MVPVIRNAEKMNFAEIEKTINTLAKKATNGTISIDEMAGGSFTISNGGVYGSLLSTPIINPPQVRHFYFPFLLIFFLRLPVFVIVVNLYINEDSCLLPLAKSKSLGNLHVKDNYLSLGFSVNV